MRTIALSVGLLCCLFVLGCASGRYPEPVLTYMPGDGAMSCEELHVEMAKVRQEMMIKPTKIKERDNRNVELATVGAAQAGAVGGGVVCWASSWCGAFAGIPFLSPWGEIDNYKAEEVELKALHERYNHLFMIAAQKGCALGNRTITIKKPGGREVTLNDILKDELPPHIDPLAIMSKLPSKVDPVAIMSGVNVGLED